jgi:integrase
MKSRRQFGHVRKLPSKRHQAYYYRDGQRFTGPHTFDTAAQAKAWLSLTHAEILRGTWVNPSGGKTTVDDLARLWLRSNPTKRASSWQRDEAIIRTHVLPELGSKPLAQVTRAAVQTLVDTWAASQAASTVGREYSTLRAMFAWAVAADMLPRTPCRDVRLPRADLVDRPEPDPDALDRLAEALGQWAPMMWLGAVGGLRWAECAGLQVQDLDFDTGQVTVARQLTRGGNLEQPKTKAGARSFALPRWLVQDLAHVVGTKADDGLVFTTEKGTPLSYANWRSRVWHPACEQAGLPGLRFHDLRSMAASALVASGTDMKTTQKRLGHASPQTTLRLYARATAAADRRAADKLGDFFGGSRTPRARRRPPSDE